MPSFRPQLLRLAGLSLAGGLAAFAGCSSSASTAVSVTHPTMIRVEPEDFLGAVPCDPNGAGLKRYVATIVDYDFGEGGEAGAPSSEPIAAGGANAGGEGGAPVMAPAALPDAHGFQAPSSLPTPCTTGVGFGFVVPGRHYEVIIDGYDRTDLVPRATGSKEMVPAGVPSDAADEVHTPFLTPRWTAHCRRAIAADSTIVRAGDCETFPAGDETAPATVTVALSPLLGQLRCGSAPGEVEHFQVTATLPSGTALDQDVACPVDADAAPAMAVFTGIEAPAKLSFYVQAFGASDEAVPLAGAECNALARAGANVDASCAALSKVGTLLVDVPGALKQLGAACSLASVTSVTLTPLGSSDDSAHSLPPPDCEQPFLQGFPVKVDDSTVVMKVIRSQGTEDNLSCHALVEPGRVVTAICEP